MLRWWREVGWKEGGVGQVRVLGAELKPSRDLRREAKRRRRRRRKRRQRQRQGQSHGWRPVQQRMESFFVSQTYINRKK